MLDKDSSQRIKMRDIFSHPWTNQAQSQEFPISEENKD
jgi:hypothetical protein